MSFTPPAGYVVTEQYAYNVPCGDINNVEGYDAVQYVQAVGTFTACVGSNIPAGYVPTALYSAPDNCGDTNNLYGYNDAQYTYFVSGTSLAVCNVGESYIVPSTEAPTADFQYQHLRRSVSQCRWL